jgi:hypothetical protein
MFADHQRMTMGAVIVIMMGSVWLRLTPHQGFGSLDLVEAMALRNLVMITHDKG